MKYIVYWVIWVSIDCGFPTEDEFGKPIPVPDLNCVEQQFREREFESLSEALKFYDKAIHQGIEGVRLDSVKNNSPF